MDRSPYHIRRKSPLEALELSELYKLLEEGELQKALELVNEDEDAWQDLMGLLEDSDESMQRFAFEIASKSGDNPLLLEGNLGDENGSVPIEGSDCVVLVGPPNRF